MFKTEHVAIFVGKGGIEIHFASSHLVKTRRPAMASGIIIQPNHQTIGFTQQLAAQITDEDVRGPELLQALGAGRWLHGQPSNRWQHQRPEPADPA